MPTLMRLQMSTQEEYNVAKQKYRKLYAKIDILNYNFQIVGTLIGNVIGNPSFSNDSTSDIRRTCGIQLYPKDSSFDIKQGGKLWIDKYIQIYIGIYNEDIQDITYTNMGIYIINNPSQTYDATQNIITISGLDLMARLTGMRNGNLEGMPYEIPQGSNVKNVLIDLISLFGFTSYVIADYPIPTPYDINIDAGGVAYDIITEILNILPNYQAYFDVNGTFYFGRIPNGTNEQIRVTDDLWNSTLISYTKDYDYENVKNYIEVLGQTHENIMFELGNVVVANNRYETQTPIDINPTTIRTFTASFITPSVLLSSNIKPTLYVKTNDTELNILGQMYNEKGKFPTLLPNTYYVVNGHFFEGEFNLENFSNVTIGTSVVYFDTVLFITNSSFDQPPSEGGGFYFKTPSSPIFNPNVAYNIEVINSYGGFSSNFGAGTFKNDTVYYALMGAIINTKQTIASVLEVSDNIATVDNDNGVISVVDKSVTSINEGTHFYFKMPLTPIVDNNIAYRIRLNNFGLYPIDISPINGATYSVTFTSAGMMGQYAFDYFDFLGGSQASGIAKETNADSPFSINGTSGILRLVLSGGEYDNINSDQLAKERANFELYQRCRLQDSVSITCVPIYWLDTNWLISITLPNKSSTPTTELYLIKSITTDYGTSSTQTINLMKYYPYYPSI